MAEKFGAISEAMAAPVDRIKSPFRAMERLCMARAMSSLSSSGFAQYEDSRIGWRHLLRLATTRAEVGRKIQRSLQTSKNGSISSRKTRFLILRSVPRYVR